VIGLRDVIPSWFLLPLLLAIALLVIRFGVGVPLSAIGLRPWREWTTTERSYVIQVIITGNVVFAYLLGARIQALIALDSQAGIIWNVFVPYLAYGFYQEVVYRGMVQLDLVRQWGGPIGILVANVAYTFGPLHYQYFGWSGSRAVLMFAAIFGIGLLFGVLFRRSGNLWMVGVMHAIGNAYMVAGTTQPG